MKEKVFQNKFREHIERLGGIAKKIPGNMYMRGWPDVYISIDRLLGGRQMSFQGWVEFKGPNTPIEPLQKKIISDLQRCGTNAFIIRAFESETYVIYTNMDDLEDHTGVVIHDWNTENYVPSLREAEDMFKVRENMRKGISVVNPW